MRGQTGVLVDGSILLDCGPDVPRSAARFGVSLAGVRRVLIGHAHPDHCGPQAFMWRSWATQAAHPLEVIAPPAAVDACRDWVPADGPVTFTEIRAGDDLVRDGYRIRAHAARHAGPEIGPAVLFDLTSPAGTRLLYAVDTAPLPDESLPGERDRPYDVLLLEETFGDAAGPAAGGDHHGLDAFAATVSALRRKGALTGSSTVAAVHLGHHNPPGPELHRRLALAGAVAPSDGDLLTVGSASQATAPQPPRAHRTLITGGVRSGKSKEAEHRLAARDAVVYVATAFEDPDDAEWAARLAAHRARRPAHWETVETAVLAPLLRTAGPPLLIDCLGLWLARGCEAPEALLSAWRDSQREVVLVTNEVGSGVVPATESGRAFRDGLGRLNALLAAESDEVWQCVAGVACRLK